MESLEIETMKSYEEFLNELQTKREHINKKVLSDSQNEDVWTTALGWKDALEQYEEQHSSIVVYKPPVELASEHVELVTIDQNLIASIRFMLSSIDFESKSLNEIIFTAGQKKVEADIATVQTVIRDMLQNVRDVM